MKLTRKEIEALQNCIEARQDIIMSNDLNVNDALTKNVIKENKELEKLFAKLDCERSRLVRSGK